MKNLYSLIFTLFTISLTSAQAPEIEWENTIGGNNEEYLFSSFPTSDGGYILGGHSKSPISGDKTEHPASTLPGAGLNFDYWIVKINSSGNIEWQNTIGGYDDEWVESIIQTSDGGYFIGGFSYSRATGSKTEDNLCSCDFLSDYWVVKLDEFGEIEWQNTIGGFSEDRLKSAKQTPDNGYIIAGESRSDISGDKTENNINPGSPFYDYWVVKLDASGEIEWDNTIGGTEHDRFETLNLTSDGGYLLGGYSLSNMSSDKSEDAIGTDDYWIVKLNSFGNIEWDNTIGGIGSEQLEAIENTNDGGYILAGYSSSGISGDKTENSIGSADYWVVKINSVGNIQWQNTIGGTDLDFPYVIIQTSDDGFLVGGNSNSNISGDKTEDFLGGTYDYWVVKLDSLGEVEWDNTLGGSGWERLYSLHQDSDGKFLLVGDSNSNISDDKSENSIGQRDYWVIKLEAETLSINESLISDLLVYPNPVQDILEIDSINNITKITIHSIDGSLIQKVENFDTSSIDVSGLTSGMYLIKLFSDNKTITKKFIKK